MRDDTRRLAADGGTPLRVKPFPPWPVYDATELAAVAGVVTSRQWWRRDGSAVRRFESEFARFQDARCALAVGTGTQALEIALAALDIGSGDEVIVPAMTFASSVTAVLLAHAVPILADIDPETYCVDAQSVRDQVTPRTRALMPVHLSGHPADMDAIGAIAREFDLAVIEDAAQAHGSEWRGRRVGAVATCGIFSFQQAKLLTAGEGGCVVTDDHEVHARAALIANCGRLESDRVYDHEIVGTNARMTELQAAVLTAQLARFEEQSSRRCANFTTLADGLGGVAGISLQRRHENVTATSHYAVTFSYDPDAFAGLSRDDFVAALNAEGIPALRTFRPVHQLPFMLKRRFGARWRGREAELPDYGAVHCPNAERLGRWGVSLPHPVLLGDSADVQDIVLAIEKIQSCARQRR